MQTQQATRPSLATQAAVINGAKPRDAKPVPTTARKVRDGKPVAAKPAAPAKRALVAKVAKPVAGKAAPKTKEAKAPTAHVAKPAAKRGGASQYVGRTIVILVQPAASGLRPTSNRYAMLTAAAAVAASKGTTTDLMSKDLNKAGLRVQGRNLAGMLARGHIALK